MSQRFDAYHRWLSIPPDEQPPNHYRLLGVSMFESDADVIENAADRQMAHVRNFQSGANSQLSQQILNEISSARHTLLDPKKKSAYDAGLNQQPSQQQSTAAPASPAPVTPAPPLTTQHDPLGIPPTAEQTSSPLVRPVKRPRGKGRTQGSPAGVLIGGAVALLAGLGLLILCVLMMSGQEQSLATGQDERPGQPGRQASGDKTTEAPQGSPVDQADGDKSDGDKSDGDKPDSLSPGGNSKPAAGLSSTSTTTGEAVSSDAGAENAKTNAVVTTSKTEIRSNPSPLIDAGFDLQFNDEDAAKQRLDWNDAFNFTPNGAHAPRGPQSLLRTRQSFAGDVEVDLNFSLSRAKFTNTGGVWLTVWGERIQLNAQWRPVVVKLKVRREGDEVVLTTNGKTRRVSISTPNRGETTRVELRWRSRTAHFRRFQISAQTATPALGS